MTVSNNIQSYQVRYEELGREHFKIRFKHNGLDISVATYRNDSISVIVCSGDHIIGKSIQINITNSNDAYRIRTLFKEVEQKCQDYIMNLLKSINETNI